MALFEYKALNTAGKQVSGMIDADTPKHARQKLKGQHLFPVEVAEGKSQAEVSAAGLVEMFFAGRVSNMDLSLMTRQFSTLVKAGLPIVESLSALVDQVENKALKKVIAQIREDVKEGLSLADSMNKSPHIFSSLYRNLVMAGEKSGTLEIMLERMADNLEAQVKQANRISSILWYPAIMLIMGLVIVGFLITSVVPKVVAIFEGMEQGLPFVTIMLIGLSDFLVKWWMWIIFFIIFCVFMFKKYVSTTKGRRSVDILALKLPFYGRIITMISVSRLTRTLSTLIASGVPLLDALDVAKRVVGNSHMELVLESVSENIREGESMAEPLRKSNMFPPLLIHMIAIGEKSGELEGMLVRVADVYDNEVGTIVDKLTSILPALLTVFMGLVVGFIVMAILLPIFDLSQGIG